MDLKSESHVFQDTKLSTLESWTLEGMDLDGSWILSEFHQTPVVSIALREKVKIELSHG